MDVAMLGPALQPPWQGLGAILRKIASVDERQRRQMQESEAHLHAMLLNVKQARRGGRVGCAGRAMGVAPAPEESRLGRAALGNAAVDRAGSPIGRTTSGIASPGPKSSARCRTWGATRTS